MKRLGIHITRTRLRVALVDRGHVVRQHEVDVPTGGNAVTALTTLLREYRAGRRNGCRTVIVPGPATSQTKRLDGLPPLRRLRDVQRLVGEGSAGFFVGGPSGVIEVQRSGEAMIAHRFDTQLMDGIAAAARQAAVAHVTVVSAATALAAGGGDGAWTLVEDGVALHVTCEHGVPIRVRRYGADYAPADAPHGEIAPAFALAIGATRVEPAGSAAHHVRVQAWPAQLRRRVIAAATIVVVAGLALAPIARWRWLARRATRGLVAVSGAYRGVASAERDLTEAREVLGRAARWERGEPDVLPALAALTRALPPRGALTAVVIDSAGVTLTAVVAHAADILEAVDASPEFAHVQIAGAVTAERAGAEEMERVSLRFGIRRRP